MHQRRATAPPARTFGSQGPTLGDLSDTYLQDYQVQQFRSQSTARGRIAHLVAFFGGVVARILTGPHDANRQDSHLPMRYDTGRPRAVIRLRISQPRTTSLPCPAGLRARRPSPMMDLYRKNAFSTRP